MEVLSVPGREEVLVQENDSFWPETEKITRGSGSIQARGDFRSVRFFPVSH